MFQNTRISRRNFLKLNAVLSSALAVSVALPAATMAKMVPVPIPDPAPADDANIDFTQQPAIRFGTPTDVAATWPNDVWSVDANGVIRKFDRAQHIWLPDADEIDFPIGSQLVLARWGRPSGPNQMLMVLAQVH